MFSQTGFAGFHPAQCATGCRAIGWIRSISSAAAGQGIALGRRYWIERHVEAGILVPLGSGPVELKNAYHGLLTRKGRRKPLARDCLAFLARSIQG